MSPYTVWQPRFCFDFSHALPTSKATLRSVSTRSNAGIVFGTLNPTIPLLEAINFLISRTLAMESTADGHPETRDLDHQ